MTTSPYIAEYVAGALQVVGGLVVAPSVGGLVQHLKGRLQGRCGPPILQPYRDLLRLWRKDGVMPEPATALYRLAPAIVVASLVTGILIVPVAGVAPDWGVGRDAVALVGLLALGRFAIVVAAWDTASGFGLMAAARDLTFAVFAEGVLLLIVLLAALGAGGSTDLTAISAAAAGGDVWREPAHWCAGLAFLLVALAETGRQPVDNPDTHLELTMVHEGPLLEYAGRDLACLQWAASARLWLMLLLAGDLFFPTTGSFAVRLAILGVAITVAGAALALTETSLAKMRILQVPLFLGAGAALALAGLGSWLTGGGL
jgi:formate hydrogenlyase subunit 4